MTHIYDKTRDIIDSAQNILIISHRKPDPDTVGAALCLNSWLTDLSKEVTLACVDRLSPSFSFLPGSGNFVREFDLSLYDLMIIVDAGASYMTNFHLKYPNMFEGVIPIINIDHHSSNDNFADINIVQVESASTTVVLYEMFSYWGIDISADMATCLLAGIYSDTGSFMHSNTSEYVLDISAKLMNLGAKITDISTFLFKNNSVASLRLWGRVLEKAVVSHDSVIMSVVRDIDYEETGSNPEQLSGVIDYLNMVPGARFAVLINEDRKGNVKGSFRTRCEDVDLSQVAASFGGGGHAKASGFSIPGRLQGNIKYSIVSEDLSKKTLEF